MALIRVNVRLSPVQLRLLDKLGKHLQLDRTNTIRLAIAKLAQSENIRL